MITHTYATLEVSKEAYNEIRQKLEKAGYSDQFIDDVIDMYGIALIPQEKEVTSEKPLSHNSEAADVLTQAFNSLASSFQAYKAYKHCKNGSYNEGPLSITLSELKKVREEIDEFYKIAQIPQELR